MSWSSDKKSRLTDSAIWISVVFKDYAPNSTEGFKLWMGRNSHRDYIEKCIMFNKLVFNKIQVQFEMDSFVSIENEMYEPRMCVTIL